MIDFNRKPNQYNFRIQIYKKKGEISAKFQDLITNDYSIKFAIYSYQHLKGRLRFMWKGYKRIVPEILMKKSKPALESTTKRESISEYDFELSLPLGMTEKDFESNTNQELVQRNIDQVNIIKPGYWKKQYLNSVKIYAKRQAKAQKKNLKILQKRKIYFQELGTKRLMKRAQVYFLK